MAKNIEVVEGVKTEVVETLNVIAVTPAVAAGIFGLSQFEDGSFGWSEDPTKPDELTECTLANVATWSHLSTGYNSANRPIAKGHVDELLSTMGQGEYHPEAHLVLVFDSEGYLGNGQHTLAALILHLNAAIAAGVDPIVGQINMVLVAGLSAECIDLLDNSRQRTLKDALARRGFGLTENGKVDAKGLPALASAIRFLRHRYTTEGGATLAACKSKLSIQDGTAALCDADGAAGSQYSHLPELWSEVKRIDEGKKDAEGKMVSGSKGRLSSDKTDDCLKIPGQYLLFCGQVLLNGGKVKTVSDYGRFLNELAFGSVKEKTCITSLRSYLVKSRKSTKSRTSSDFWSICQALILAFLDWNSPKSNPDFDVETELVEKGTVKTAQMEFVSPLYQGGEDVFVEKTEHPEVSH